MHVVYYRKVRLSKMNISNNAGDYYHKRVSKNSFLNGS